MEELKLTAEVCSRRVYWRVAMINELESEMILGLSHLKAIRAKLDLRQRKMVLPPALVEQEAAVTSKKDEFEKFLEKELKKFRDVSGATHLLVHKIRLKEGAESFRQHPYPCNPLMQEVINKEVDSMLNQWVIEPSSSPWSSPIVLVKKANGKMRFCINLHQINALMERDAYPLPNMTGILD
ncbi:uncharacterized protein LOC111053671 [Nilaparvata lugens]|uniref:uncharacterized protein LOC111053671 n=1 Tax=Nilaparvata lugens TaxID=108931 RepID=UPI00193EB6BC|nr:uncharacterized protein LOC111053671 [Nilaparvata lugens]